jgi:predicted CXXCH cytochrome family protein
MRKPNPRNVPTWLFGAVLLLLAGVAQAVPPATQPMVLERPQERTKSCTTAGCHAKQTTFKVQHGPVALGACDTCHAYSDEKKHTFKIRDNKEALCTFCHIAGAQGVGTVVHKPVTDGDCLGCHNPHGGSSHALLKKDNIADLCASCHQDVTQHRKHLHGPVASGSCLACHSAHRSVAPKLLAAQGRDLCLGCHDTMADQMKHARVMHKPLEGDCQQCHETHASNFAAQLKKEPVALCESCHEPIAKIIATAPNKHSAATTGQGCLNCHTPHGGQLAKLMKTEPIKACLACHDKKIEVAKDHIIPTMAAVLDPTTDKHGPIREGDCSGCHLPHGGPNAKLLAKPYDDAFYQSFEIAKYELCFSCHDKELVLKEKTPNLTKFRNGEQNLHFLHVNKEKKGRNCRACHSTHTSTQPVHLRETVPFGKWEMPISFSQTPTGGSCKPGCHEEMLYDRNNPAKNKPVIPTGILAKEP